MNDEILTPEQLIEEVEMQALTELDECLDTLTVTYCEFQDNKKDKELKELYEDAIFDLKTLLGDYVGEDESLIQEAYDELFESLDFD